MITSLVLSLVLLAEPEVSPQSRELIEAYLGSIDRPIRSESWRALGEGADAALAEVAEDESALPSRRARALEGLQSIGGERAEKAHLKALRDRNNPHAVRGAALRGLGKMLPTERVRSEVSPLLNDGDRRIRTQAALVLVNSSPSDGCARVRNAAAKEKDGNERFHRALRECARAKK